MPRRRTKSRSAPFVVALGMQETPLMRQYWEIKSAHEDKLLFFRMGDFFELFFEDAKTAAPILGIALTQRNKKSQDETPMCGLPHHAVAGPINKLLGLGFKVALCDQVEDAKQAKGLVRRAVTRVLTPGMVYDPDTLDSGKANYICAVANDGSLAYADPSTGESFYFAELNQQNFEHLLQSLPAAEFIVDTQSQRQVQVLFPQLNKGNITLWEKQDDNASLQVHGNSPLAVRQLYSYLLSLNLGQGSGLLQPFVQRSIQGRMKLSAQTLRHLEVFTNYQGGTQGTLFMAIDRTQTASGKRALRDALLFPFVDKLLITKRQKRVNELRQDLSGLRELREFLSELQDLQRRLAKLSWPQCSPRDLESFAVTLTKSLQVHQYCQQIWPGLWQEFSGRLNQVKLDSLKKLSEKIATHLREELPNGAKQGQIIRSGLYPELDELIDLHQNAHLLLQKMEENERARTQIPSLKIRYNSVFGYYIEVTNTHKEKIPKHYLRKQTLANAERFYTDELQALEEKLLSAQTKRFDLEFSIFESLRSESLQQTDSILLLAQFCAQVDLHGGLAWLAMEQNHCLPVIGAEGIHLRASRHPVAEQIVKSGFVANDITLAKGNCLMLTGPNMAGKSTLMRQVALSAILAQVGAYVPAKSAEMPIFDGIFTRIGASDFLSEGLSTFMVEMQETAEILKAATSHSLIILDEIGRGTATYDGMALAKSICEYILKSCKSFTFFATHYHELTSMAEKYQQIQNAHMRVSESQGKMRFLYSLMPGAAGKSYGIQVAKLAGLPNEVIQSAQKYLQDLEGSSASPQLSLMDFAKFGESRPMEELGEDCKINESASKLLESEKLQAQRLIDDILQFAISEQTPLQAMNQIAQWQEKCRELS